MIDIIIPVLDEQKILEEQSGYYKNLSEKAHIVFVDGGSNDKTVEVASRYGQVVVSKKGRALQKNSGVGAAKSNYLCFLHVDTQIDIEALSDIEDVLSKGTCGGCLTMAINDSGFVFRIFENIVNWRANCFKVFDGDLGQFVRRDVFAKLGGYDSVTIMEDILFSRKLRNVGNVFVLPNTITVSSRKWHEKGFCKLFFQYVLAYVWLWTGQLKMQ